WVLETGWRWMMLSLAIPAMAFFYLSFSVPESPDWLVKKGRIEQARKLLSRSADPDEVREILAELATASPEEKPAPLFSFGARVVLVGIALSGSQQLVGIDTVLYFWPAIFARMGYHMDGAFLGTVVASMVNLLVT